MAGGVVPIFRRALLFPLRVAIQDDATTYTYAALYTAANDLSTDIAAQLCKYFLSWLSYIYIMKPKNLFVMLNALISGTIGSNLKIILVT